MGGGAVGQDVVHWEGHCLSNSRGTCRLSARFARREHYIDARLVRKDQ